MEPLILQQKLFWSRSPLHSSLKVFLGEYLIPVSVTEAWIKLETSSISHDNPLIIRLQGGRFLNKITVYDSLCIPAGHSVGNVGLASQRESPQLAKAFFIALLSLVPQLWLRSHARFHCEGWGLTSCQVELLVCHGHNGLRHNGRRWNRERSVFRWRH